MGKGETLMPAGARPFRSGTKNPMGKDRVRDRKIKKLSQMMESQNKKPSKRIYFEKDRLKKMVEKELNKKPMDGPSKLKPPMVKGKPKPSLGELRKPRNPKGTGAPIGGFRKPKFNPRRVKPGS